MSICTYYIAERLLFPKCHIVSHSGLCCTYISLELAPRDSEDFLWSIILLLDAFELMSFRWSLHPDQALH